MINIDSRLLDQVTPEELYLLSRLANRTNKDRTCFPGGNLLAKECGWSKSKLQRIKKSLYAKKLLSAQARKTESAFTSNLYKLETSLISKYNGISTGEPSVMDEPTYVHGGAYPISTDDTTPISTGEPGVGSKLAHKVLGIEGIVQSEALNKEELRKKIYLSNDRHKIFEKIIDCLYPHLDDLKSQLLREGATDSNNKLIRDEGQIQDATTLSLIKKLRGAAAALYSAYEKLNQPIPVWREYSHSWCRNEGQPDAAQDAIDQLESYVEWCRITKTWVTKDPEKLPEKILQEDWCLRLKEYADQRFPHEYDPMSDFDGSPQWLMEYFYEQQLVWIDKRNNRRIF